jgi:A/G-specific adenine glycosylase
LPYYHKFLDHFPTIHDLANASIDDVLHLWQGLGYYSRARNMHNTARELVKKSNGEFPQTRNELLKLKGIGPYTASAMASFCFEEPEPSVDGNVLRVVCRYFGIEKNISKNSTKNEIYQLLKEIIPISDPASFNQALMEFGSLQCKPKNPDCLSCPFKYDCYARNHDLIAQLPMKEKKTGVRNIFFNYVIFRNNGEILMKKRDDSSIWKVLYDFFCLENDEKVSEDETISSIQTKINSKFRVERISDIWIHILSHRKIYARFFHIAMDRESLLKTQQKLKLERIKIEELDMKAKPVLISNYINAEINN